MWRSIDPRAVRLRLSHPLSHRGRAYFGRCRDSRQPLAAALPAAHRMMADSVSLPSWLLVIIAAFALWAFYDHVLLPLLRWVVTHPADQVIDEIGKKLRIDIRPFQRTRRQILIHRLLGDPKVMQ